MKNESDTAVLFPARPSLGRNVLWVASVALIYFTAARLSLLLRFEPEGIAAIWPPAGIFLSAILLTRRDLRPWLVGTLFVTDFIAEMLAGAPLPVSAIYSLSLTGDAALSAWLLHRFVGEPITFRRVGDVAGWLALSVLLSNGLTSLADAAASKLLPGTHSFWSSWQWSAAPEGAGNLLVTPFILTWAAWARTGSRAWNRQRALEGAALFILLALVNFALFSSLSGHKLFAIFLPYAAFPFLLWAALRFGVRGVATAMILLAAIAVTFAARGRVPSFSFAPGVLDDVIVGELLLAITAVPALFLAAAVAQRQQAHNALRQAEELHRVTLMSVGDAVISTDVAGRVKLMNQVAETLTGWRQEEARGKGLEEVFRIINEDTRQAVEGPIERVLREGLVVGLGNHTALVARDGTERSIADAGAPIRDEQGRIVGVVLVFRDQTQQRAAAKALRESEERFAKAFRAVPEALIISRLEDGKIVEVNDAWPKVYGYSREEVVGKRSLALNLFADPACRQRAIGLLHEQGSVRDFELQIRQKAGALRTVILSIELLEIQGEKHLLTVARDITERKRSEEALRGLSLRLTRAEDAERRRIARDLHDSIGQKLAALSMSVGLLQDATNSPGGKADNMFADCVALIEQCAQEIRTLSQLLHPPLLDELGLVAAIRNCVEGFSKRSGTHVTFDAPPALERLAGEVEIALFRVVQEGLSNIYRHAGAPSAHIRLACDAEQVMIEVMDQGCGMSAETLQAIQAGTGSLGVGIAGMRERMRLLGGRLEVESGGQGTTVRGIIPQREEPT